MRLFILPFVFIFSFCISSPLSANEHYTKGSEAYNKGDFETAIDYYQKAIKDNDSKAEFALGLMYFYGRGLETNEDRAISLLTSSANKGNQGATFLLGRIYIEGNGAEQDIGKAVDLYTKAAENGYSFFQYLLGSMYLKGEHIKQDTNKAIYWFEKAGEQGSNQALLELAKIYENGLGEEKNETKALEYYNKSADLGNPSAIFKLKRFNTLQKNTEDDRNNSEIWVLRLAGENDSEALYELDSIYSHIKIGKNIGWNRQNANNENSIAIDIFNTNTEGNKIMGQLSSHLDLIPLIGLIILIIVIYSIINLKKKEKGCSCSCCHNKEEITVPETVSSTKVVDEIKIKIKEETPQKEVAKKTAKKKPATKKKTSTAKRSTGKTGKTKTKTKA